MAKDRFSTQSQAYAAYRPRFPAEMFNFILQNVTCNELAWDAGTGNGQAAMQLARFFKQVIATDISENQLAVAFQESNIEYRKEPAEQSSLVDKTVDLVTVSQAFHWFDFDPFYNEVRRVLKPGAVIALFCYSAIRSTDIATDEWLQAFYKSTAEYWDYERRYVDTGYGDIPFPFEEIDAPQFAIHCNWTPAQLTGYIETWSASQHYYRLKGERIIPASFEEELLGHWKSDNARSFYFPVHLRIGRT